MIKCFLCKGAQDFLNASARQVGLDYWSFCEQKTKSFLQYSFVQNVSMLDPVELQATMFPSLDYAGLNPEQNLWQTQSLNVLSHIPFLHIPILWVFLYLPSEIPLDPHLTEICFNFGSEAPAAEITSSYLARKFLSLRIHTPRIAGPKTFLSWASGFPNWQYNCRKWPRYVFSSPAHEKNAIL